MVYNVPMSTPVEQIKERINIEELVGSYVKLERAGKNLKAKCPFHNEKTPSFYVSPDRGSYYCFGCGAKGDIFSFVEQFEGLDFMGALKMLAERAGVDISKKSGRGGAGGVGGLDQDYAQSKSEKERLYAVLEEATVFFEKTLRGEFPLTASVAIEAREYVKKRGITDETAKKFRIGFAVNDWRQLCTYLKSKGYKDADIEKAGLSKQVDAKAPYDRFRDRIMFPIADSSGRIIAFSGRILHDDGKSAKYLNSPDTPLYTKSTVLYGIDKAKQGIRMRNYTILVEGQMDLVLSHQAGISNTVAVSGTALAEHTTIERNTAGPETGTVTPSFAVNNLGIVKRLSSNIILAFDSDAAGRKAAMRSARIALSLDMDVKIADLPEGKDPADMVLADPESWKEVLRHAKPVVEFQLDGVLADLAAKKIAERNLSEAIRERVLPFIALLNGKMKQAFFIKLIRDRVSAVSGGSAGVYDTEAIIWEELKKVEQALVNERSAASGTVSRGAGQTGGKDAIVSPSAEVSRLDLISRKLFGLLAYLAHEKLLDVDGIYATVQQIAGDERYHNLIRRVELVKDELSLEAEIFFGTEKDIRRHQKHIDELLLNFEEDIVREDFALAMAELSRHERKGDKTATTDITSSPETSEDLMKKCQALSLRLAEIAKKRALN